MFLLLKPPLRLSQLFKPGKLHVCHAEQPTPYPAFFGQINPPIGIPNLLKIQLDSFERFLQRNVAPEQRDKRRGLEAVFRSVFPISDYSNSSTLNMSSIAWRAQAHCGGVPGLGVTYACPIRVALRLIVWEKKKVKEVSRSETSRNKTSQGNSADDADWILHHQRNRACDRQPNARVQESSLTRQRQRPLKW